MIRISKILVPIAYSQSCAWAARYARRLALHLNADLIFVHIVESPAEMQLETFLTAQIGSTPHHSFVVDGDPAESIVALGKEQSIDLILMPTHAHGRFRRFLLGSVTAKVLHDAQCPVWTGVHHRDAPMNDDAVIRSIVCAVDLDDHYIPATRWAQDLAATFQATVHAIHAIPAADETSDNAGEIELRRYLFQNATDEFARRFKAADLSVKVSLSGGNVARVVREAALRHRAELVVIGRGHTLEGLGRLRTQAYSIIRESPCPVLSI